MNNTKQNYIKVRVLAKYTGVKTSEITDSDFRRYEVLTEKERNERAKSEILFEFRELCENLEQSDFVSGFPSGFFLKLSSEIEKQVVRTWLRKPGGNDFGHWSRNGQENEVMFGNKRFYVYWLM